MISRDDYLERRIAQEQQRLNTASGREQAYALANLSALVRMRSPEAVAELERQKGLRGLSGAA